MLDPTEISELVRDLRECGVDMHSMHCRLYKVDLKPESCGFVLVINQAADALAAAQAENEKLRAALKPFAEAAADLDDNHADLSPIWESAAAMSIAAKDLRRACEALATPHGC